MSKAQERLEKAEKEIQEQKERLQKAKAFKQRLEAGLRNEEAKKARAIENRQKYLLGAFIMAGMKKSGVGVQSLSYESKRFTDFLTLDKDRELFGLKPLPVAPAAAKAPEQRPAAPTPAVAAPRPVLTTAPASTLPRTQ